MLLTVTLAHLLISVHLHIYFYKKKWRLKTRLDYSTLFRLKCCHRNIFSYKYIIIKKGGKRG